MNQKMLALLGEQSDKYPAQLEAQYPHVFEKLLELWGTDGMHTYLDELMMSRRPGRIGFPEPISAEIWALSSVYSAHYPSDDSDAEPENIWV